MGDHDCICHQLVGMELVTHALALMPIINTLVMFLSTLYTCVNYRHKLLFMYLCMLPFFCISFYPKG